MNSLLPLLLHWLHEYGYPMLLVRRLVKTLPQSKETLVAYQAVSTQKLIVDTTLPVSTLHHIAEVRSVNIGEQRQEVPYS